MMKKTLAGMAIAGLALCLAACGGDDKKKTDNTKKKEEPTKEKGEG
ncbi:MAG: hypothetical protein H6811_04450 [Phycisphaeraceae bacterium]|nr:hypothetical protein [Phycisphaeraceae bacterium]